VKNDERNAAKKAKAVLSKLTPDTPRSDFDVFLIRYAAGFANDAGKTYAAIVLNALLVEMDARTVTPAAINHARSVVDRWLSELGSVPE
jgi:hypothetical protein